MDRGRFAGLLLGLAALAGCGDEEETVASIPLEQFAQSFHQASCEHGAACNFWPDQATCLSSTRLDPGVAQAVVAAQAGKLTYDPAAGAACVQGLRTASCLGNTLFTPALRKLCDPAFGGRGGEGDPCSHASECQGTSASCEGACDDACCMGTCRLAAGVASLGEPCADDIPCDTATYCKSDAMNNFTCAAKAGPGESCDSVYSCVDGYACDPSTNTCFKQADPGGQCNPTLAADGCGAIAEYCDPDTSKCVPNPGPGKPCASNALAQNFCAPFAECDMNTLTCVGYPVAGDSCPNSRCLGEFLEPYGVFPLFRCGGNGTCEEVTSTSTCTD